MSVKINADLRAKIVNGIVHEATKEAWKKMNNEHAVLAEEARLAYLGENAPIVDNLPINLVMSAYDVRVYGMRLHFIVADHDRMVVGGGHSEKKAVAGYAADMDEAISDDLHQRIKDHFEARAKLDLETSDLRRSTEAALRGFRTVSKLATSWPEAAAHVPEEYMQSQNALQVSVDQVRDQIANFN